MALQACREVCRWIPRILVRHGAVRDDALKQEQITRAELLETLRREGYSALTNVRFAVLETDGSITLARRSERKK
jgi:uncharacterized membrane protein YcaP (DUF421 family)